MNGKNAEAIDEAAIQWFVLLRGDAITPDERHGFAEWLAIPEHHRAWSELERTWGGLDLLADKHAPGPTSSRSSVVDFAPSSVPVRSVRRWPRIAAAAMLLVGLGIGWQLLPAGLWSDYRSAVGERRTVNLADGSVVELATGSAMNVSFDAGQRKVTLLAGEAFFTVAKDVNRPFVVAAEQGQVTVRGTAFNVRIDTDVSVAVSHNAVDVSLPGMASTHLTEGNHVSYDARGLSTVQAADLDSIQGWRQDRLFFHDAPLSKVVSELQRYRRGRIQLLSPGLGDRRVTAVFDTTRTDAALETIARSLDLNLFRVTDLFVGITRN